MNKSEIINHIAFKYKIEKEILSVVIAEIFNFINEKAIRGEPVNIKNFGTFYMKEKAEQLKYHPIKKKKIIVPAKRIMTFRPTRKGFLVIEKKE